jgi:signal transduction histidine kinase
MSYINENIIPNTESSNRLLIYIFFITKIFYSIILFSISEYKDYSIANINYLPIYFFVSLASFFIPKAKLNTYFSYSLILFSVLLTYSKYANTYPNGSSPNAIFMEIIYSITIIYVYGVSKTLIIPIIFIISSLYKIHYFSDVSMVTWDRNPTYMFMNNFFFSYTIVYTIIFVSFYENDHNKYEKTFKNNYTLLKEKKLELIEINKKLKMNFELIENLAEQNSHKLRAPLARIKGISLLIKQLEEDGSSDPIDQMMFSQISSSLDEIQQEVQKLKDNLTVNTLNLN